MIVPKLDRYGACLKVALNWKLRSKFPRITKLAILAGIIMVQGAAYGSTYS